MNRKAILTISIAAASACHAVSPSYIRHYHDTVKSLNDTIVFLDEPDVTATATAVELRGTPTNHKRPGCRYGIVWSYDTLRRNYYTATLSPSGDDNDAVTDSRHVNFEVTYHKQEGDSLMLNKRLTSGMDCERYTNTIGVDIDGDNGMAHIYAGGRNLMSIAEVDMNRRGIPEMGVMAVGRCEVEILMSEKQPDMTAALASEWNEHSLTEYMAGNGLKPEEGLWRYLDRSNDDRYCRMGGDYTVAIVDNGDNGFDIIYLSGAETNGRQWHTGLKKGQLIPTQFAGHYNLVWYDATMRPLTEETSATIETGEILRLDFPLLRTSIRLAKLPTTQK